MDSDWVLNAIWNFSNILCVSGMLQCPLNSEKLKPRIKYGRIFYLSRRWEHAILQFKFSRNNLFTIFAGLYWTPLDFKCQKHISWLSYSAENIKIASNSHADRLVTRVQIWKDDTTRFRLDLWGTLVDINNGTLKLKNYFYGHWDSC